MTKKINFTDVNPLNKKELANINNSIFKVIRKKNFILGNEVAEFEKEYGTFDINIQDGTINYKEDEPSDS